MLVIAIDDREKAAEIVELAKGAFPNLTVLARAFDRRHAYELLNRGADQVAKIAASMAEFGWTVPRLLAEDGELIAGHGRVLAATQLSRCRLPPDLCLSLSIRAYM